MFKPPSNRALPSQEDRFTGSPRVSSKKFTPKLYLRASGAVPFFLQFLLLFVALSLTPAKTLNFDSNRVLVFMLLGVLVITLHLLSNLEKNWLRIDTVFILGFVVVNYQWPLMYAVSDFLPLYSFQTNSLLLNGGYAVWLATIFLISWTIGYAVRFESHTKEKTDQIAGLGRLNLVLFFALVGFSVAAGSSFFTREIYTLRQESLYLTVSGVAAYFFIVVEILAILTLSFLLYARTAVGLRHRATLRPLSMSEVGSLTLLCLYCFIFLLGGERGQVVYILLAAGLAIATNIRPVRLWEFALLAVLGFSAFTIVGAIRSLADGASLQFMLSYGYWGISNNLAQSVVTVTQAVQLTDERGDYFWGALWISQLLGLIPFVQSIFLAITGLNISDISSAMQITTYTFGSNPHSGLGTSPVADTYLNFGVPGVVVFSFLYGLMCRQMSIWISGRRGYLRFFAATAFGGLILYITRSSLLFQLQPIVWGSVILVLLVRLRQARV